MRLSSCFRMLALALAGLSLASGALAQGLTLTDFTFSPDKREIGRIVARPAQPQPGKMKLSGSHASLFTIGRDGTLAFRKSLPAKELNPWYDVVIRYTANRRQRRDTLRVVKDDFIRNQVIAHRGAWKNTGATENSIGALQHAIRLGCAGSEFDVHMSADSALFVNHDHHIQGIGMETSPAAALARVKLSNGENLPTVEAYLQEGLKQNKTRLILEMKPSMVSKERSLALARKSVEMVRKSRAQGWVDYISFDYDMLRQVLALDPYARVAYLKGDKTPEEMARDKFYGLDYHFGVLQKNPGWMQQAHQKGLTINVWTVNAPDMMDWFLERKADFITTNEPELLLQKLRQAK